MERFDARDPDDGRPSEAFWRDLRPGDPFPCPRRVGSCEIEAEIGRGGFGIVYRAIQDAPRRVVALKLLRPGLAGGHAIQRMRQEAEILARLDHPGIARVFEAGEADLGGGPQPYFVMELIEGPPLLAFAGDLDLRARVELLARVAHALQHAHQKGVVHRDVNPSNILVRREDGQPKVIDFGVAALRESDPARAWCTREGQMVGTLPYMSPEQVRGQLKDIDTLSDVYSLGVVGFQLLTGSLPYPDADLGLGAVPAILHGRPRKARAIDPRFPRDLELVLDVALRKDPERRYATADAFAADLERFLEHRPIVARPSSALYVARTWAQRNPGQALAGALAACCAIGGVAGLAYGKVAAERESARKQAYIARSEREVNEEWLTFDSELRIGGAGVASRRILLEGYIERTLVALQADPRNPSLRAQHARFTVALASLEIDEGDVSLGLDLLDETQAILDDLARDAPLEFDALRVASLVDVRRGDVARSRNRLDVAKAYYERALDRDRKLVAEHPREPRALDDFCWSLERKAWWLSLEGRHAERGEVLRERHALALDLLDRDPVRVKALHNAAWACLQLAGFANDQDQPEERLRMALEALKHARELVDSPTKDPAFRTCYGSAMAEVGRALTSLGERREALPYLEQCLDAAITAYQGRHHRPDDLRLLYFSLTSYLSVLDQPEDREAALAKLDQLLLLCDRLEGRAPNGHLQRLRAMAHSRIAILTDDPVLARNAKETLRAYFEHPQFLMDWREHLVHLQRFERDPHATYQAIQELKEKDAYVLEHGWSLEVWALTELGRFDEARACVAARGGTTPRDALARERELERIRGAEETQRGVAGVAPVEASAPAGGGR